MPLSLFSSSLPAPLLSPAFSVNPFLDDYRTKGARFTDQTLRVGVRGGEGAGG